MRPWGAPAEAAPTKPAPEPERPTPLPKPTLRPQRQEKEEPAEEDKPSNVVPLPKPKQRRIPDDEPDPLAELRQHVVYEKGDWGDKPVPKNARNFTAYVQYHPDARDRLRLNLFTNQITVTRAMPWGRGDAARALDDRDVREAKLWLWHAGLKPSTAEAHEAMTVTAERNAFDPVREHLESLAWDGVPRLRTWLTRYMGVRASNTKVEEAFGMRWFVSGVARILAGPQGAKVDTVLVLEGSQGLGKSQALRIIATMRGVEYFLDDLGDIAGKDALLQLAGQVIVELAELKTINRSSVDAVKEFLSKKDDTYRAPYERVSKKHARRCIFAATVNPTGGYLKDPTGARRFWPVNIEGEIDLAGLERDRDQLWAEAVHLFKAGEKWWLQGEEVQHAEAAQALRYQDDVWSDVIDAFMAKGGDYTVSQILHLACGVATDRQGAREKDRVEAHLKARGFRRRRTQRDGENVYVYGRARK
jgi:predicted P-loop ATPase